MEEYRSRVYTDRPAYADLDSPEKFQAIQGIYKAERMLKEKIAAENCEGQISLFDWWDGGMEHIGN